MKRKIGMLILTLALAAGLTACGNRTTEANPTPSAPAVEPTSSPSAMPGDNPQTNNGTSGGQAGDNGRGYADGRSYRGGDAWMGNGDDALDNAYDVIQGAVNGAEDKVQGFLDGMDNSTQNAARDIQRMGGEIRTAHR